MAPAYGWRQGPAISSPACAARFLLASLRAEVHSFRSKRPSTTGPSVLWQVVVSAEYLSASRALLLSVRFTGEPLSEEEMALIDPARRGPQQGSRSSRRGSLNGNGGGGPPRGPSASELVAAAVAPRHPSYPLQQHASAAASPLQSQGVMGLVRPPPAFAFVFASSKRPSRCVVTP